MEIKLKDAVQFTFVPFKSNINLHPQNNDTKSITTSFREQLKVLKPAWIETLMLQKKEPQAQQKRQVKPSKNKYQNQGQKLNP